MNEEIIVKCDVCLKDFVYDDDCADTTELPFTIKYYCKVCRKTHKTTDESDEWKNNQT